MVATLHPLTGVEIGFRIGTQDLQCDIKKEHNNVCQDMKNSHSKLPSLCQATANFTQGRGSLLRRLLSKLKIYYGDNDKPVPRTLAGIKGYLKRFGYIDYIKRLFINNIKERVGAHRKRREKRFKYRITFGELIREDIKSMADVLKIALKMFQKFMRLDVTGIANTATVFMMNRPRCAGKDLGEQRVEPAYMTLRNKIKNFITRYPTKYRNEKHLVDDEIAKALKIWSDVTPLVFLRLPSNTSAKDVIIDIRFEQGEHGDGDPLDGAGKVLAHSYFPQYGGDAHFDDDEMWTIDSPDGSNIMTTAMHEFGHSLGLDHSDVPDAIMNPIYPMYTPGQKIDLHQDDLRAIQILYGARSGAPEIPNLCVNASVDAMYKEVNSCAIFVFKGKYFWKIRADEMKMDAQYPKPISEHFPGLESNINAVIQFDDLNHFVFKEELCYKYSGDFKLEDGFPIKIKDLFHSLPTTLDSAISYGNIIYAAKGGMVWQHIIDDKSGKVPEPQPIESVWPGIPPNINTALKIKNAIYFFKDQGFYRLNQFDGKNRLPNSAPPYPRKTSLWWFGCQ